MTREDVIRMAREAGIDAVIGKGRWGALERFAALVAAEEREACAALIEENARACSEESTLRLVMETNAAAIRARGES